MFDYMDEIIEAVADFGNGAVEVAEWILLMLAKTVILITTPVWILPYMLMRDCIRNNGGGKCELQDCNSCPFPPCEKGEAENE